MDYCGLWHGLVASRTQHMSGSDAFAHHEWAHLLKLQIVAIPQLRDCRVPAANDTPLGEGIISLRVWSGNKVVVVNVAHLRKLDRALVS